MLEDQVEIPALFLMWPTTRLFSSDEAELQVLARILADGADSRLHRRLIEHDRIAQSVTVTQDSWALAGQVRMDVHAMPGHDLTPVRNAVDEEIAQLLGGQPPTEHEVARAVNQIERSMAQRSETRLRRAMDLAMYYTFTGDADDGTRNLTRYRRVTPASVQVKKGEPTVLAFTRKSDDTCARQVVFPELSLTKDLPLNQTVEVQYTPSKSGEIRYGCAMGLMVSGVLLVE